jgi:putative endonuclease
MAFLLYRTLMFYVYIIYSKSCNIYYKGFTLDCATRLCYHNTGQSPYTSKTNDWELVYSVLFETKREALIEEKRIKRLNVASIEKLISSYKI